MNPSLHIHTLIEETLELGLEMEQILDDHKDAFQVPGLSMYRVAVSHTYTYICLYVYVCKNASLGRCGAHSLSLSRTCLSLCL